MKNIFLILILFAFNYLSAQSIDGKKIVKLPVQSTIDETDRFILSVGDKGKLYQTTRASLYYASTYTPVYAAVQNVQVVTSSALHFQRVGTIVEVWGTVSINPTNDSLATEFTMTLPVTSSIAATGDLAGFAVSDSILGQQPIRIFGDVTGDKATFKYRPFTGDTTAMPYTFSIKYKIL